MKFKVQLTRISKRSATIEVEADDPDEADVFARINAQEADFSSEYDYHLEVDSVQALATCHACKQTGKEGEGCPTCPGFVYSTNPDDFKK